MPVIMTTTPKALYETSWQHSKLDKKCGGSSYIGKVRFTKYLYRVFEGNYNYQTVIVIPTKSGTPEKPYNNDTFFSIRYKLIRPNNKVPMFGASYQ